MQAYQRFDVLRNTKLNFIHQVANVSGRNETTSMAAQLSADVPAVLRAASRQLRDKSPKMRAAVFQVLKELIIAVPTSVTKDIDQLMTGIISALNVSPPALSFSRPFPSRDPLRPDFWGCALT